MTYIRKSSLISIIPVVMVQFLSGFDENILRSVFIVSIAFSIKSIAIHHDALVNWVNISAAIPVLLFSSYTGKLADKYNKTMVIRGITFYQMVMAILASTCIYYHLDLALLVLLLAVAFQQTFLYSVRFSILTDYINTIAQIGLATSFIEFAWFTSTLVGQIFGTLAITSHKVNLLAIVILVSGILSIMFSLFLKPVHSSLIVNKTIKLYGNPLKDCWLTFKEVAQNSHVLLNMNTIGWLALFGAINTAQMAIFVARYVGADGHVFAIILGFGTLGMGIGSIMCAKIFRGRVKREVILVSAVLLSVCTIIILSLHPHLAHTHLACREFIPSISGILLFGLVFVKSISFGFYSLTSYTEAQLLAKGADRSQAISMISVIISVYIIIGSSVCYVAQIFVSSWGILFITSAINLILAFVYWRKIQPQTNATS